MLTIRLLDLPIRLAAIAGAAWLAERTGFTIWPVEWSLWVQLPLALVFGEFFRPFANVRARVVHENIDAPEVIQGRLGHGGDRIGAGDVHADRHCLGPGALQRGDRTGRLFRVSSGNHH